ncbi:Uma2 family endonuclease [Lewinella sp. IMCC34191]|uniref:Uma2 family endonuclease n=1 Tax=Lewinella sp. IMCC34191 TaxID=2259172 RepID=UPI000E27E481|nr:Uma2 family endonuclease [Lewinella sp. IMCC34191]
MTATADPNIELLAHLHFITVERYHAMIEAGILGEDDPVELLNGKIVNRSPIGRFHAVCVRTINAHFVKLLDGKYLCSQEQPITIAEGSEPEPDYVIAWLSEHNYLDHHPYPEDIHLLIEVADKTLPRDRGAKRGIYACAGIPEYWIVNLIDRQLEIYTQPDLAAGTYTQERILHERDTLIDHPLAGTVAINRWIP